MPVVVEGVERYVRSCTWPCLSVRECVSKREITY